MYTVDSPSEVTLYFPSTIIVHVISVVKWAPVYSVRKAVVSSSGVKFKILEISQNEKLSSGLTTKKHILCSLLSAFLFKALCGKVVWSQVT